MTTLIITIILFIGFTIYSLWYTKSSGFNSKKKENSQLPETNFETSEELTPKKKKEDREEINYQSFISNLWKRRGNSEEYSRIPANNYHIDTNSLPKLTDLKPQELLDHNRLTLLTKDPYWIYAYWNIKNFTTKNSIPLLKVYDITYTSPEDTTSLLNIHLTPTANNWYFKVPKANRRYYAQIGLLTNNNIFIPLINSNPVITPPNKPHKMLGSQWMKVTEENKEYVDYKPNTSLPFPQKRSKVTSSFLK